MKDLEIITTGSRLIKLQKTHITKPMDLISIHGFLFQGLYSWAGRYRNTDAWKNGTTFCSSKYIPDYIAKCTEIIYEAINNLNKYTNNFTELAYGYNKLNKTHPFKDGNGRTQREWLRQILCVNGYILDLNKMQGHDIIKASYLACHGDYQSLINAMQTCITKTDNPYLYYKNLNHLAILSCDDNALVTKTIIGEKP